MGQNVNWDGRAVEQLVLNLFTAKSTILIISVVGSRVGPALTARKPTGMARSYSYELNAKK